MDTNERNQEEIKLQQFRAFMRGATASANRKDEDERRYKASMKWIAILTLIVTVISVIVGLIINMNKIN
jgi:hypothetical protein